MEINVTSTLRRKKLAEMQALVGLSDLYSRQLLIDMNREFMESGRGKNNNYSFIRTQNEHHHRSQSKHVPHQGSKECARRLAKLSASTVSA